MKLQFLPYETAVPSGVGTTVSPVWHWSANGGWHSVHPKIITFSYMGASPGLMQLCVQEGVKLTFLTPTGRYIGSLEGPTRGNVLLRRTQYRIADDEPAAAHFAALFISTKIANQRSVLGRFVLTVINKRQVAPSDFITQGENGYILRDEPRKELLAAWQQRKREEIMPPFLQERIPIGLLPYAQALLLARCLRGDLDDYPVFLIQN